MKTIGIFFFLCLSISSILAFSQPVIRDTKATCTIGDRTGDCCVWEDVKLFPGDGLNHVGHCRRLYCADNFDIRITPCPFDMEGKFEWINKDKSKPYPECCGEKVPRVPRYD